MERFQTLRAKAFFTVVLLFFYGFSRCQTVPDTGFVYIPANTTFAFATDVTNTASSGESSPVTSPYVLSKTLVTNAQYKAFCTATNHSRPGYWSGGTYPAGKADHPVLQISYTDAQAYCSWLNTQYNGYTFRLPTEAELENAAWGPNKYAYPWGNGQNSSYSGGVLTSLMNYNGVCAAYYVANYAGTLATYNNPASTLYNTSQSIGSIISVSPSGSVSNWINHTNYTGFVYTDVFDALVSQGGYTSSVYAYPAGKSYYGCYDMAGNAFEWSSSLIIAQNGAEAGTQVNAVRSGSWYSTGTSCKTGYRGEGRAPSGRFATVGFRVAATPVNTLPVTLLSFKGETENGANYLTWKTAAQLNFSRFVLERSNDGNAFFWLATVPATDSTAPYNTYVYRDATPADGNTYYRLKMVNLDGSFAYSSIVGVINNSTRKITAVYSGQTGVVRFSGLEADRTYQLLIYNIAGQLLLKRSLSAGGEAFNLNLSGRGLYVLSLWEGTEEVLNTKLTR